MIVNKNFRTLLEKSKHKAPTNLLPEREGVKNKAQQFSVSSASSQYDIIYVTESWLHSSIHDRELIDNIYSVYRRDRDPILSQHERGGGIFTATKRPLQPSRSP